ncbi:MAG: type II toxin-antitoxin system prevent-host-death family antitoxin [bacterium]
MRTMTALDLRKKLGSVLDEVAEKREQVVISRGNKPLAVLISVSEFEEKVQRKNREKKLLDIAAKMEQWRKKHRDKAVRFNVAEAVRETREER